MLSPFLGEPCEQVQLRRAAGEDMKIYDAEVYVDEFCKLGT